MSNILLSNKEKNYIKKRGKGSELILQKKIGLYGDNVSVKAHEDGAVSVRYDVNEFHNINTKGRLVEPDTIERGGRTGPGTRIVEIYR